MGFVIGIDQGSTKTYAALSDGKGNILATEKAGGAEHHVCGLAYQISLIDEVCSGLVKKAGIRGSDIDVLFGGLCGVDWPEEADLMSNEIKRLGICENIHIVNDSIVAFRGGTFSDYGAVICAGTGVNCAVISPDGSEFIYGFFAESTIQGSSALGRYVLDAVYKSSVSRLGFTRLTEKTQKRLGIDDIEIILRMDVEHKLDRNLVHCLAVDLFEAAYEGDGIAVDLIKSYGAQIATMVNARTRIFGMENMEFDTVISGSIFKGPGTLLKDVVTVEIRSACPRARIVDAKYEPVVGAVISALKRRNGADDKAVWKNIERSSCELGLLR